MASSIVYTSKRQTSTHLCRMLQGASSLSGGLATAKKSDERKQNCGRRGMAQRKSALGIPQQFPMQRREQCATGRKGEKAGPKDTLEMAMKRLAKVNEERERAAFPC